MQNRNKSDMHWKDKLKEAGSFPYEPASKELAWEKLNNRLREKKRRKKTAWYWVAAACLLPLLFFVVFSSTHQPNPVVKEIPKAPTAAKPSADAKPGIDKSINTAAAHQLAEKKAENKETGQKSVTDAAGNGENNMPADSGTTDNIAVVAAPKEDSTGSIAFIAQPQKKKLRVVHINELNEPFDSSPAMPRNIYHPRFLPLQIASESIFPEPLKTVHSTDFISLKSKSSN